MPTTVRTQQKKKMVEEFLECKNLQIFLHFSLKISLHVPQTPSPLPPYSSCITIKLLSSFQFNTRILLQIFCARNSKFFHKIYI